MNEVIIKNPYCIENLEGFTPSISHLIGMMNYARQTTLESVKGLSVEQLDYQFSDNSNSIGALLAHIAAVESCFQIGIFDERNFTDAEYERLEPALKLGTLGRDKIKGYPLEHYIEALNKARAESLKRFSEQNDEWLLKPYYNSKNIKGNNYFEWFHVFEDEINHRGQIRLIRKMQGA